MLRIVLFTLLLAPLGCMTAPNPLALNQNLPVGANQDGSGDLGGSGDGGIVGCICCGPSGDMGPLSSDLGPATSDLGPTTSDLGPTTSDLGPTTSDLGPTTSDLGPTTSDLGGDGASDLGPEWNLGSGRTRR
jgi:hypothetical protein